MFNTDKLDWFNQQHMLRLDTSALADRIEPLLRDQGLWNDEFNGVRRQWFLSLVDLYKPRVKRLDGFGTEARPLLMEEVEYDDNAVRKHLGDQGIKALLTELATGYEQVEQFVAEELERELRQLAESRGVKAGSLIHATRVAVTGRAASPGLFEVLELIGRDRSVSRMRTAP